MHQNWHVAQRSHRWRCHCWYLVYTSKTCFTYPLLHGCEIGADAQPHAQPTILAPFLHTNSFPHQYVSPPYQFHSHQTRDRTRLHICYTFRPIWHQSAHIDSAVITSHRLLVFLFCLHLLWNWSSSYITGRHIQSTGNVCLVLDIFLH